MNQGRPNQALEQTRDSVLRYGEVVGCELLNFFVGNRRKKMIPERIQRYAKLISAQPTAEIEKKAKRLRNYSWLFLGLLLLMLFGYVTDLMSGKKSFAWNEAVAVTLPFIMMAGIMGASRDTLLIVLCMRKQDSSQPATAPYSEPAARSPQG